MYKHVRRDVIWEDDHIRTWKISVDSAKGVLLQVIEMTLENRWSKGGWFGNNWGVNKD